MAKKTKKDQQEQSPDGRQLSLFELESELTEAMEAWLEVCDSPPASDEEDQLQQGVAQGLQDVVTIYLQTAAVKRDKVAQFIIHLRSQEDLARAEVQRMEQRARRIGRALDRMKRYVAGVMESQGVKKLEGEHYMLSLQKTPDSIDVLDPKLIPERHMVDRDPVPDKRSIMEEYQMLDKLRENRLAKDPQADVPEPSVPGTVRRRDGKTVVIR